MRYFLILLLALCIVMSAPARAAEMGIAIVVNDDAISVDDLNDRLHMTIVSSNLPNTQDTKLRLAPQVIGSLVEEQLRLQESRRAGIEVSQMEIERGFAQIAEQNNFEAQQFKEIIKRGGINVDTMFAQIESQIAWTKFVQRRFRPQVTITDNDIDAVIERLERNLGKTEYFVAEIFLPIEETGQDAQVRDLARELVQQVSTNKAPFSRLARQFSRAPGAAKGGMVGWVQEGQMAEELDSVLVNLQKGQVSQPIRTLGGYHILFLRDARQITPETIPPREAVEEQLGLERLDRLQRRHLMDLKSSAFIENRLGS